MQIPLERLLLETDSPDGLPQVSDEHLARAVEAAVGGGLLVLPQVDGGRGGAQSGAAVEGGRESDCAQSSAAAQVGRDSDRDTQSSTATEGDHRSGSSDGNSGAAARGRRSSGGNQEAATRGDTEPCKGGSSGGVGSGAVIPLDWRCPLDVQGAGGSSIRVEHPRQLLNQPANVRRCSFPLCCCVSKSCILHPASCILQLSCNSPHAIRVLVSATCKLAVLTGR